ncbi:MAG: hypothetical protein NWR51_00365 [Akkermansiaceae bacterium]|nr:hypothetical protein [Akkermansiaceae bacterium]
MPETPDSQDNLSIRCPSCRQRFSVEPSLMDRMVECGGCDARFRINDEVILRTKKFYPGERKATGLSRFQRVPMSAAAAPPGLQPMRYDDVSPSAVGPVSPQRVIAGLIGVGLMIFTALILIFSVGQSSSFSAMTLENKLIIACFVAVIGFGLLMYANPRSKKKAGFFGILLAAGLITIPFFFKGQPLTGKPTAENTEKFERPSFPVDEIDPEAELRERFTTKPLEDEQAEMEKLANGQQAFGIYLTNLVPRNMYTVRDYLIRDTEAGPTSHPFPREDDEYLMILTELNKEFEEVARIAGKLGETTESHPDIGVIVVKVNNDLFKTGSSEKLNNPSDPAFYALNQYELDNIDIDRVERAVERLANAKPKIFRSDISKKLVRIMTQPGVDFHDSLAKALIKWAEEPGPAGEAALEAIRKLVAAGSPVPESLVELTAKEEIGEAIPLVNQLWLQNPGLWEKHLAKFGPAIEPLLLKQINAESAPLQRSTIKLLGQVGSATSLPALQELIDSNNAEVRVLTERAIEAINAR